MAQSTMYPAMAGSPKTELSTNLAADGTTAYVDNLEKLPAAPNVVTFWIVEDTWERCVYSAKSAETGPGTITIARSGAGHASSAGNAGLEWAAGTKVARNPGELDHTIFKANIEDLETRKITASGVTYENLAANSDIGTGATQVAQGNHTHTPASLGAASGSVEMKTLYVYGDATGTGDGSTKANGFTTLAACLAAMPDVINHAYVIMMCDASAPYAATTIKKIVGSGSITIEGEFYKNGTVASAGSTVGKFNTQVWDTGVASGDKVLMIKYSGTVGSSTPSDGFIDTVASVLGTEITLTTRTSDAFDNSWQYVIVRTRCEAVVINNTDNVTVNGLHLIGSSTYPLVINGSLNANLYHLICTPTSHNAIVISDSTMGTSGYIGVAKASIGLNFSNSNCGILSKVYVSGANNDAYNTGCVVFSNTSVGIFQQAYLKAVGEGVINGVVSSSGSVPSIFNTYIDGYSSSYKVGIALEAYDSAQMITANMVFGSNITTQKSPANWAATTDGSFIS